MAKSTKGFCKYCGKEYTRAGIAKHLQMCKKRVVLCEKATEAEKYFELLLYGAYNKDYWLIIQIKETATLDDLDRFIRDIWVECCGHLSAFEIDGVSYERESDDDFGWGEPAKSTSHKLKQVITTGMIFNYEYDFGSTTEIMVKVLNHYSAKKQNEKVMILSRNNPPQFACSICGNQKATWINTFHIYDEDSFWCEECVNKLEAGELEAYENDVFFLPITNSPRMGVCGYEGSNIYPEQFEPDMPENK